MFFRHKLKVEYSYDTKTQYGHTYKVIKGFLFIPDKFNRDHNDMKKKNFVFVNHTDVPDEIKEAYAKLYSQNINEMGIKMKSARKQTEEVHV